MKVRGCSFHVGSGGCSYKVYEEALKDVEYIFDTALKMGFDPLDIIDIGGGFSDNPTNYFADGTSNQHNRFSIVAPQVNHYLENVFPGKHKNVKLIGEPGR